MRFRRGLAATCLLASAGQAFASDRWEEAAGGAVAILPPPLKAKIIVGGSLVCQEQRWRFRLRTDTGADAPLGGDATIEVDGEEFAALANESEGVVTVGLTPEILTALNEGSRLSIVIGVGKADFSLRGSRAAFEAVAPRCGPVDMSAYERIVLSETEPFTAPTQRLMADEAKLFRAATGKQPTIAVAELDLGGGRALLFASLCGSTAYYGLSGCTLSGFAREGAAAEWREVYNSEGMAIYADPKGANGGWPDLLALPGAGESEPVRWSWSGGGYEMREQVMAEDTELRGAVQ